MEELIRNSISQYNDFIAEAHLYEKWLMQTDDPELKNQLKNCGNQCVAKSSKCR